MWKLLLMFLWDGSPIGLGSKVWMNIIQSYGNSNKTPKIVIKQRQIGMSIAVTHCVQL